MQKYDDLDGALAEVVACITGEVIAGLRHGHFKIEIEGEAIEKGKRRVIVDAGKKHRFVVPADAIPK